MRLIHFLDGVTRLFGALAALLILPLTFALVYEVFSRYVLNHPTLWAYEISYMVMGTLFMLGMANALRLKQHVSVDIVTLHLSVKTIAYLRTVFYLALIPLMFWLTWELAHYTYEAFARHERSGRSAWNPVMWPVYTSWFIGFLLLALQLISELLKNLLIITTGKEH
jgi:TRAP-type mannitol/chloroaromatic compound transport system permease small subunit